MSSRTLHSAVTARELVMAIFVLKNRRNYWLTQHFAALAGGRSHKLIDLRLSLCDAQLLILTTRLEVNKFALV